MVNIYTIQPDHILAPLKTLRREDGNFAPVPKVEKTQSGGKTTTRPDTTQDTVTLSEGGQKIVNLGRGQELAAEIRTAPIDENFAASLRKASQDIFRITRLFSETLRSSFRFWR